MFFYLFALFFGSFGMIASSYFDFSPRYEQIFNASLSQLKLRSPNSTIKPSSDKMQETIFNEMTIRDFFMLNVDTFLSIFISLVYLFFFISSMKTAFRVLTHAIPSFFDLDSVKAELCELVSALN